jgi:hypothetical protein
MSPTTKSNSKKKAPTTDTIGNGQARNDLDIDMEWGALDAEDAVLEAKLEGKAKGPSRKRYVYRAGKGERDIKPGEVKAGKKKLSS